MGRAKERLRRIYVLDTQIRQKQAEIESLREDMARLKSVDYTKDKIQVTPTDGAAFERIVDQIMELERDASFRINDMAVLRDIVSGEIQMLPDPTEADVLHCRYVQLLTWSKIEDVLHISERHLRRIHGRALASYEKIVFGESEAPTDEP